jgi:hypothetical protein
VDGLLAEMPARTMAEWQAYSQVEPWGEERADLRAGIVASTVANVNRGPKQAAFEPGDFMPVFDVDEEPDAAATLAEKWGRVVAAFG